MLGTKNRGTEREAAENRHTENGTDSERGKDTEPYRQKRKISETQSSGHGK